MGRGCLLGPQGLSHLTRGDAAPALYSEGSTFCAPPSLCRPTQCPHSKPYSQKSQTLGSREVQPSPTVHHCPGALPGPAQNQLNAPGSGPPCKVRDLLSLPGVRVLVSVPQLPARRASHRHSRVC